MDWRNLPLGEEIPDFFGTKSLFGRYSSGMNFEKMKLFLDLHEKKLILYARQWSICPEDVVQDALLELIRKKLNPEENLAWLYRVIRNKAISEYRRKIPLATEQHLENLWFEANTTENLDSRRAQEVLQELDESMREVIVLKIWSELSFDEIASVTGFSKSEAHRRYQQGIEMLRQKMGLS